MAEHVNTTHVLEQGYAAQRFAFAAEREKEREALRERRVERDDDRD